MVYPGIMPIISSRRFRILSCVKRWRPMQNAKCKMQNAKCRSGYALVEALVVISVNSVLMAVAVTLLGTLLRSENQGQHHCERTSALVRFSEQFRDDLAAARQAEVVGAPNGETLDLQDSDEHRIEYVRDGDRIRRIEHQGSSIVRREAYTLADLGGVHFIVSDSGMVTARLAFSDEARGVGDSWRIDARLAKDRRFAAASHPQAGTRRQRAGRPQNAKQTVAGQRRREYTNYREAHASRSPETASHPQAGARRPGAGNVPKHARRDRIAHPRNPSLPARLRVPLAWATRPVANPLTHPREEAP
jgi:type II secretory pathway pseudopilin PulG